MPALSEKTHPKAADRSEKVRSNSVFKRMITNPVRRGLRSLKYAAYALAVVASLLILFKPSTANAWPAEKNRLAGKQGGYDTLATVLAGWRGTYYVDRANGRIYGKFPGRGNDTIAVEALGPILAHCVADNGNYFGVSRGGLTVIYPKGAFSVILSKMFNEEIALTDSPKMVKGQNGSVILTDKNLFNQEAGVYVIIKFFMGSDNHVHAEVTPGEKMASLK
jgi:hypothetical protein